MGPSADNDRSSYFAQHFFGAYNQFPGNESQQWIKGPIDHYIYEIVQCYHGFDKTLILFLLQFKDADDYFINAMMIELEIILILPIVDCFRWTRIRSIPEWAFLISFNHWQISGSSPGGVFQIPLPLVQLCDHQTNYDTFLCLSILYKSMEIKAPHYMVLALTSCYARLC